MFLSFWDFIFKTLSFLLKNFVLWCNAVIFASVLQTFKK